MDERLRKYQRAAYAGGGVEEWSAYAHLLEPLAGIGPEEEEAPFDRARLSGLAKQAIGARIKHLEALDLLKEQQEKVLKSLLHHGIDTKFGPFEVKVPNLRSKEEGKYTKVRINVEVDWDATDALVDAGQPYDENNPPLKLVLKEHTYRRYRSIGSWEELTAGNQAGRDLLSEVYNFLLEDTGGSPA